MTRQQIAETRVTNASSPDPDEDTPTSPDEEVEEQSEESFPASDPPAY